MGSVWLCWAEGWEEGRGEGKGVDPGCGGLVKEVAARRGQRGGTGGISSPAVALESVEERGGCWAGGAVGHVGRVPELGRCGGKLGRDDGLARVWEQAGMRWTEPVVG